MANRQEWTTNRLFLRTVNEEDAQRLFHFESKNYAFWAPFTPLYTASQAPLSFWEQKIQEWEEEAHKGQSCRFLLFGRHQPEGPLVGSCNFTQIFRGNFQACYLGYKLDQDWEGKGLMYEALSHLIQIIFQEQKLHRIMANYLPSNVRSERLLLKLGFVKEGYAKEYLQVQGRWEDHILTALINKNI